MCGTVPYACEGRAARADGEVAAAAVDVPQPWPPGAGGIRGGAVAHTFLDSARRSHAAGLPPHAGPGRCFRARSHCMASPHGQQKVALAPFFPHNFSSAVISGLVRTVRLLLRVMEGGR